MSVVRTTITLFALFAIAASVDLPFIPGCKGSATYKVTFRNLLTPRRFGEKIPPSGLNFSPLAAVSHSNRISFFTIRGFANEETATIAKTGVNTKYIALAAKIKKFTGKVLSVVDAGKLTLPGRRTTVVLKVDCFRPSITVIGMIAPSPDWIAQINNQVMYDVSTGQFIERRSGNMIAYDAGVDDGDAFTPPLDLSLDIPTKPQKNIAPLVEDETDAFNGQIVGRFSIQRIH